MFGLCRQIYFSVKNSHFSHFVVCNSFKFFNSNGNFQRQIKASLKINLKNSSQVSHFRACEKLLKFLNKKTVHKIEDQI